MHPLLHIKVKVFFNFQLVTHKSKVHVSESDPGNEQRQA